MKKKIKSHIFVSGKVQGIFFRDNTRKKALDLGVTGWIRNLADGRVEAVFEGEKDKVEKMVSWVREGPAFAKINNVSVVSDNYSGESETFEIRK